MVNFYFLVLFILATYRITHVIVFDTIGQIVRKPFIEEKIMEEEGKLEKYSRLRYETGIGKWLGQLFSCYWCVGVWVSFVLYVLYYFFPLFGFGVLCVFAVAGGAALVETLSLRWMD